jgi:CheY-like chemotaxis protein
VPHDDESRPSGRWSEPPPGDPHRDVTGALHDVSNALTVLLGWVGEARNGSPDQTEKALAIVEQRARAARDVARRAIGAAAVIDDVVVALSVEAQRAGVALSVRGQSPAALVASPGDVSQILTNVVLNAIAWSPRGASVTIEGSVEASLAYVVVQDAGPGVPPVQAPFVFDGMSSREGGAGVGLRHARAMARAAGGDLELLAGSLPRGARFRLRWPRTEVTLPRAPASMPRTSVLAGTRVLVVEDDEDVSSLLQAALGARGANVVVVRNAEELAKSAAGPHDAALVDFSPIAQDVRGAIAAIRKGSPGLALVFISGSAVGLPEGIDDESIRWVRKPFEVSEIVEALTDSRAAARAADDAGAKGT